MSTSQTCNTFLLVLLLALPSDCSSDILFNVRPTIIDKHIKGESYTIGLSINSTDLVVLLTKNRDVSSTYKVYTQDESGNLITTRKAPSCQYHGSVAGYPHSNVVLSNCDGLSGKIQFGRTEYRIESVKKASSGSYHRHSHIDYGTDPQEYNAVLEDKMTDLHTIKLPPIQKQEYTIAHVGADDLEDRNLREHNKTRAKRLTSHGQSLKEIMQINVKELERRYLELSVVIDNAVYRTLGSDKQMAVDYAEDIVNIIASKYKPYNLIPCIVQLEIWDRRDKIRFPNNYTTILGDIVKLRQIQLQKRSSDVTIVISGVAFKELKVIGAANTNSMCDDLRSVNVNTVVDFTDKPYVATLIAHEIGHVIGMHHDNNEGIECECPCRADNFKNIANYKVPDFCGDEDRCIMYSTLNRNYDHFSICSRVFLEEQISKHRCLFNTPSELHSASVPTCGNAVIEEGETCDCGSPEDCPILDPCCEVGTCQLRNTSSCFTGACCDDQCHFKKRGTLCREKTPGMECDFQETCRGSESSCPRDTYKQDGRQCKDSGNTEGFCSGSHCQTHLSQCKMLYGERAQVGSEACWKQNDVKESWLGNCGAKKVAGRTTYKDCDAKNIMCGLLHCEIHKSHENAAADHVYKVMGQDKVRFGSYKTPGKEETHICLVSMFHYVKDKDGDADESEAFVDLGQVLDYTKCDTDLFCYKKKCTFIAPPKCPSINGSECGGHGTCNNLNQCHCDKDWSNDMCVDFDSSSDNIDYKTIITVLCIAVFIVPVIVGLVVYIVKHKFDLKKMDEDRKAITRGLRRFSTRMSSRARRSTRSDDSSRRNISKAPTVTNQYARKGSEPLPSLTSDMVFYNPTVESESKNNSIKNCISSAPTGRLRMKSFLSGIRVPKIGDSKRDIPLPKRPPSSKPESKAIVPVRVPPKRPAELEDGINNPILPVKPSPNNSHNSSKNSSPDSSTQKLNGSTGGGPPPVLPPPPPATARPTLPVLRKFKDGSKAGRLDDRPQSETFKNVKIPFNNLQTSEKTASETSLTKKPLQPPKRLAGISLESKKLQISGPGTNGNLVGLDGRAKSFLSATDIKQSSDSINTVSSTRALFDPKR